MRNPKSTIVMAIVAHPDDVEFMMGGTLLLLKQAGCETHYLNVANGNCGSVEYNSTKLAKMRAEEGRRAAKVLGAHFHPSLTNDLEIVYELKTLRRLSAIIRELKPAIVLTHSPHDYMEDHMNTCRLAVTAAFTHGIPNFKSVPPRPAYHDDVTVYHGMPHGLQDGLRRPIIPASFVNTASVHKAKLAALAEHRSQQNWLDTSQGFNSYLAVMEEFSLALGRMSRKFKHAEGWRRHLHYGFASREMDPLADLLGKNYLVNKAYEKHIGG